MELPKAKDGRETLKAWHLHYPKHTEFKTMQDHTAQVGPVDSPPSRVQQPSGPLKKVPSPTGNNQANNVVIRQPTAWGGVATTSVLGLGNKAVIVASAAPALPKGPQVVVVTGKKPRKDTSEESQPWEAAAGAAKRIATNLQVVAPSANQTTPTGRMERAIVAKNLIGYLTHGYRGASIWYCSATGGSTQNCLDTGSRDGRSSGSSTKFG